VLFLYEMTLGGRTQLGVVGCVHVEDYASNLIRKHELTRRDKEDDRTRHILTLGVQAEPVLLAHGPSPFLAQLTGRATGEAPLFDFDDGAVRHRVWRIADPEPYVDAFRRIDHAYVADGHHRSASAWRAAEERKAANPRHTGREEYNWFLAVLFPAPQLQILPYHRVIKDLGGMSEDSFLARLAALGELIPTSQPAPDRPLSFGVCAGGRWYRLKLAPAAEEAIDPVRSLDAALLHARVLEPVLGIGDIRSDPRIGFVGGAKGIPELERQVQQGEAAVAFALYPVSMQQLMRIADAGAIMPPKSTWFEPKLASGLFLHALD
jgi:uncharacterized protein (DUF1015 family)